MDLEPKQNVFEPKNIAMRKCSIKNKLYTIIQKDVVKPVPQVYNYTRDFDYTPKNNKFYVPKKISKQRVVTVGDVRRNYEEDILETLPHTLQNQQEFLLKKIRDGFSEDMEIRNLALKLMNLDRPISKPLWEILKNLNPECHNHSSQFMLWNGKCIQVNGSRGGKNKFICHYNETKVQNVLKKRRLLLHDYLNIKFKPGPLSKKIKLDISENTYHGDKIKLVELPRPTFIFKPLYGAALNPMIIKTLTQNFCEDGTISEKWAELAVSALGKVTEKGIEIHDDYSINFNLNYKWNQKRILMRHDFDTVPNNFENTISNSRECVVFHDPNLKTEVKNVLEKILDVVEISLAENLFYCGSDESRQILTADSNSSVDMPKRKRKRCELSKLDDTITALTEKRKKMYSGPCQELFCSLGCVCDSLERGYNHKEHCGQTGCIFDCKCNFTKYKIIDSSKCDPSESSFKTSKKYADFQSNINSSTYIKSDCFLCIPKLKLDNVEPWCLVHNLYKCFCKLNFTQSFTNNLVNFETPNTKDDFHGENNAAIITSSSKTVTKSTEVIPDPNVISPEESSDIDEYQCLRNKKNILKTEKSDKVQTNKVKVITNPRKSARIIEKEQNKKINNVDTPDKSSFEIKKLLNYIYHAQVKPTSIIDDESREKSTTKEDVITRVKRKFVQWIVNNYKEINAKRLWEIVVKPPQSRKITLLPHNFILNRYLERKNLFLICKDKPFRIFMAIDANDSFFENCINIRNICKSRIHEYPSIVHNLINNVQCSKDSYILCGSSLCWEFIGTVSKHGENKIFESNFISNENLSIESKISKNSESFLNNTSTSTMIPVNDISVKHDAPRWFVMTLAKDVTEIHFMSKGFSVKYDNIVKAKKVAREIGKTMMLSPPRCSNDSVVPRFAVYATPELNGNTIFIGPYNNNEPLGIKVLSNNGQASKETSGHWITLETNDVDVLKNLFSVSPHFKISNTRSLKYDNNNILDTDDNQQEKFSNENPNTNSNTDLSPTTRNTEQGKKFKPIIVRKLDGYNCLASQNILKRYEKCILKSSNIPLNKPFVKLTSPIKISKVSSLNNNTSSGDNSTGIKSKNKGMVVLKPEEINNRLKNNFFRVKPRDECEKITSSRVVSNKKRALNEEIFLESSKACASPVTDTIVIPDEENDYANVPSSHDRWRKVWIVSTSIKGIGWIQGRRNNENKLSFEFPGFEFTKFYEDKEAFEKLNEVFLRKVFVTKKNILKWRVVDNEEEVNEDRKLRLEDLSADVVLSKEGLIPKSSLRIERNKTKTVNIIEEISAVASTSTEYAKLDLTTSNDVSATHKNFPSLLARS